MLVRISVLLVALSQLQSATLKPETKDAWDSYVKQAAESMQARIKPNGHFLWLDEDPQRMAEVRARGSFIAPIDSHIPKKVPGGLIHHWLGAGFIPDAKIEDIVKVLRDYDHYKDIYKPGVIESTSHGIHGSTDLYTLRLANKSAIAKIALDTDCESTYIRIDDRHWYGITNTVHIQEVEKFGTPEQKSLPEDTGTGLIWRLYSISRLEERDGGVYTELEAVALSRDIPAAFHLFVMPIVRRVSRDSMATSLHETKVAIDKTIAQNLKSSQ